VLPAVHDGEASITALVPLEHGPREGQRHHDYGHRYQADVLAHASPLAIPARLLELRAADERRLSDPRPLLGTPYLDGMPCRCPARSAPITVRLTRRFPHGLAALVADEFSH
jgi:hypothetical protein